MSDKCDKESIVLYLLNNLRNEKGVCCSMGHDSGCESLYIYQMNELEILYCVNW